MSASAVHSDALPRWIGAYAEHVGGARGDSKRLSRVVDRSPVPMTIVDRERRHVEVNGPARLAFRRSLDELRRLRIDDLTAPQLLPVLEEKWRRLMETGRDAGAYEVASPQGCHLHVVYYALGNALPGLHLIMFVPAAWPESELVDPDAPDAGVESPLSARELQVLSLAADGCNGPQIAGELTVSPATVRTHFEHIYRKLQVCDRAAAVAKAMRLGLIA